MVTAGAVRAQTNCMIIYHTGPHTQTGTFFIPVCFFFSFLFCFLYCSLYSPSHLYSLSPFGFGALQWLYHYVGDTTTLAKDPKDVSLSYACLAHECNFTETHITHQQDLTHTRHLIFTFLLAPIFHLINSYYVHSKFTVS